MIYFIQETGRQINYIKIGFTNGTMQKRLSGLQTASPSELKLLLAIEGNRPLERSLHDKFSDDNVSGEWFYPSQKLQEYIKSQASKTLHIESPLPYIQIVIDFAKFDLNNPDHYMILVTISAILLIPFVILSPDAIADIFIPILIIFRVFVFAIIKIAAKLGVSLGTIKNDLKSLNGSVK